MAKVSPLCRLISEMHLRSPPSMSCSPANLPPVARVPPVSPFLESQHLQWDSTLATTSETTPSLICALSSPGPLPVQPRPGLASQSFFSIALQDHLGTAGESPTPLPRPEGRGTRGYCVWTPSFNTSCRFFMWLINCVHIFERKLQM